LPHRSSVRTLTDRKQHTEFRTLKLYNAIVLLYIVLDITGSANPCPPRNCVGPPVDEKKENKLDRPWSAGLIEAPKWLIPWSNCSSSISITVNYHVNQDGGSTVSLAAVFGAFDVLRYCRASLGAAAVVDAGGRGCWSSVGSAGLSNRIERQAEAFPRLCRSYVVIVASFRDDEHHADNVNVAKVTCGTTPTVFCYQSSLKLSLLSKSEGIEAPRPPGQAGWTDWGLVPGRRCCDERPRW
jgi:hypothetical protein